jgi:hypothetical protein
MMTRSQISELIQNVLAKRAAAKSRLEILQFVASGTQRNRVEEIELCV